MSTNTYYWSFFCSPKIWAIDQFLESGEDTDSWKVTESQKSHFKPGQKGIIRVGKDTRNQKELNGRKPLLAGIYAIVEVLSEAEKRKPDTSDEKYWVDKSETENEAWRVEIKYLHNLIANPIIVAEEHPLYNSPELTFLQQTQRYASLPLQKETFDTIQSLCSQALSSGVYAETVFNWSDIAQLEQKYANATPIQREVISKRIERGAISNAVKKYADYECQICKAQGKPAQGFKKKNGEPYIETHHVFPVSEQQQGSLGLRNLMTLCANHHRQVHFGDVEITVLPDKFLVRIDGESLNIDKFQVPEKSLHAHDLH